MGVVWRAEDTILGRAVAIKFLPAEATPDEERRQMFLKEARLASSVSDARIVQVFELGREDGLDFIVMELVEGKPLTEVLGGRALPVERIASIGEQVSRALARAHQKQLLHRDIKPGNILITPDGDVKVVDFGLASLFQPNLSAMDTAISTLSRGADPRAPEGDGRIAGTLPYMSPEQVRGEKLDGRSDIFSLGTVLYEMTTGRRPFVAPTMAELAAEIQKARLKPVRDLAPNVPMELDRIVQKALAPKPADRYQTMQDLAVDLKRLGRELESGSAPSYKELQGGSARSSTSSWALSTKSGLVRWTLASVVVAVAVAASIWTISSRRAAAAAAARAHAILIMPFEVRGRPGGAEYVGRAFAESLAVSLAQLKGFTVLPVAGDKDLGASGALDRIRAARSLGAGMILTGALTREGKSVSADLSLTDVEANRLVWGARKTLAEEDLGALATSLVQQVQEQLGANLPKRYEMADVPYGSPEFLASRELAEAVGSSPEDRARDLEMTKRLVTAFPREPYAYLLRILALHWNYAATDRTSPGWQEYNSTLSRMIELDPNSPWAERYHADQLAWEGKRTQALALLTGTLAREDLSPALRAWLLVNRADTQETLSARMADLHEANRLVPVNWAPVAGIGETLLWTGRNEEALTYLQRALVLKPRRPDIQTAVGSALQRMGRLEEALPFYLKGCELAIARSHCVPYGIALARLGRTTEAVSVLGGACDEERATCANFAVALQLAGRIKEAQSRAAKAEVPPEPILALYSLACYHALAGDRAKALRYLKRDVDLGDTDIWIAEDPFLKSLHGDPEFEAIVAEIKKRINS
jgi:tetratricopeptide (TPR) repeat protein/predicted Ser/Thr protein kinase